METYLELSMDSFAILTARLVLGVLFFFQAYDKVFTVGLKEFTANIIAGSSSTGLNKGFIRFSAIVSSYIELLGSVLLILGLFLPWVYVLLALNLVMVSLAFSYLKPLWDMSHVFPRLVLLIFLMMMPMDADLYTLTGLFP
jgi:putative oxidoreductase